MCNPIALGVAGLGLSAAGQYQQYRGQRKEAARGNAAADQNIALAHEEFDTQMFDIRTAQGQVADDARTEESERVRAAREEAATISTIAGEYGDGNNTTRLVNDAAQAAAQDVGTIQLNRDRRLSEVSKDATAARIERDRQVAGINSSRPTKPSRTGLMLGIAGTALQGAEIWQRHRPK